MIKPQEYKERRERLYKELVDNSILILFAGVSKKRSADEDYPFSINRNFYYLTNIEQEGSILVTLKIDGEIKEYLFISEYDELKEKWTGKRLTIKEAKDLSMVDNVLLLNIFTSKIKMFLEDKNIYQDLNTIYLDFEEENKIGPKKTTKEFSDELKINYDNLKFLDVYKEIISLRMIKSNSEIEELKEAITNTNYGLKNILNSLKPNKYEYQMSSLFYYSIQDLDHSELSFPTICASGKNATCLHYPDAKDLIKDGDLVLFDLGARKNYYCADISRTYPANGKFTNLEKIIYTIVLECNKYIINLIKPGVTLKELNDHAIEFMFNECKKHNLLETIDEFKKVYFHNVGHHLGLDTHDPSFRDRKLVAGNIITDEPGLYFEKFGIGVRIEDDILVTEDGSYNLSGEIIKEIKDIEKAMLLRK